MGSSAPAFAHRGVVEGFYGEPWSHADRLWLIERLGAWGMNRYVYAPKDDPLHRERWRDPYSDEQGARFRELVKQGEAVGVAVGFAVSPGLSMRYASADDTAALVGKFRSFEALGARFLSLALDDVPQTLAHEEDRAAFDSLAAAHVAVAHQVRGALAPETALWLVPTDYLGSEPTAYLETLGATLDPAIEIGWTGRTIVSPTITSDEAAARSATLGRRLLLWDNVPVNDGPMRHMLHLGPYAGRDPGLSEHCSGVMLNPMPQARASAIALRTAALYLEDPARYDPERAWARALEDVGGGEALRLFAEAHRFSPLWPEDRDRDLEDTFATLTAALEAGEDLTSHLATLRERVRARLDVAEQLRGSLDAALVDEVEPWLRSHHVETARLDAALGGLEGVLGATTAAAGSLAFMGLQARLTRIDPPTRTSYGPRRAFYPQLESMSDMQLGPDPALFRRRSLVDEILEFVEDLALFALSG